MEQTGSGWAGRQGALDNHQNTGYCSRGRSSARDLRAEGPPVLRRKECHRSTGNDSIACLSVWPPGKSTGARLTLPKHFLRPSGNSYRDSHRQWGLVGEMCSREGTCDGYDSGCESDSATDAEVASLTSGRRLGIEHNEAWLQDGRTSLARQSLASGGGKSTIPTVTPPSRFRDEGSPVLFALVSPAGSSCRLQWPFSPSLSDRGSTPGVQSWAGSDTSRSWGGSMSGRGSPRAELLLDPNVNDERWVEEPAAKRRQTESGSRRRTPVAR